MVFNMGVMQFNSGKLDEAAAAFKKLQTLDPSNAETYYFLGTIALNQGKTEEAVANLEKYLSLNPTNAQFKQTAEGLVAALKPKK
jgi:Flp pilus assembly protein TadD